MCNLEVEDECHFMFRCPKLCEIRKEFFGKERVYGDKLTLQKSYLAEFSEKPTVTVAKYVCAANEYRVELLKKRDINQ